MGPRVEILATVSGQQLIDGLRRLILGSEDFRPEAWSLDDAETLERCARAIREGHARQQAVPSDPADDPLMRRVIELFERRPETPVEVPGLTRRKRKVR